MNMLAKMGKACMAAVASRGLPASTTIDTTTTAELKAPEMTFKLFKPYEYIMNKTRTHLSGVRSIGSGLQGSVPDYLKEQVSAGSVSVFAAEVRAARVQSHPIEVSLKSHPLKDIPSDNEEDSDDQEAKDVKSHPLADVSSDWEVEDEAPVAAAAAGGCKKQKVPKRGSWVSRMWRKRRAVGSPAGTPPGLIAAYHGSASPTTRSSSESSSDGSFASEGVLSSQSSLGSFSSCSTPTLSHTIPPHRRA